MNFAEVYLSGGQREHHNNCAPELLTNCDCVLAIITCCMSLVGTHGTIFVAPPEILWHFLKPRAQRDFSHLSLKADTLLWAHKTGSWMMAGVVATVQGNGHMQPNLLKLYQGLYRYIVLFIFVQNGKSFHWNPKGKTEKGSVFPKILILVYRGVYKK